MMGAGGEASQTVSLAGDCAILNPARVLRHTRTFCPSDAIGRRCQSRMTERKIDTTVCSARRAKGCDRGDKERSKAEEIKARERKGGPLQNVSFVEVTSNV